MFLIFVSPTVSLKKRVSTRFALTILSRGITRSSRPNLNRRLELAACSEMKLPGGLTEVSVPHVVGQDALGLVLQQLHAAGRGQTGGLRLEQDDCLHAAALGGVGREVPEPADDLQDGPHLGVQAGRDGGGPGGEEVGDVPGYRPLAEVQQEQVLPALLQQQHLQREGEY